MDEVSRYAVGLDVGTENVRAVVLSVSREGMTSVVGYGEAPNAGSELGWSSGSHRQNARRSRADERI